MAARKKRDDANGEGAFRAVAVLLEDLRGQFKVFGEQLGAHGVRLDRIDTRLDGIDTRLDDVEQDLGLVKTAVLDAGHVLKEMVRRDEVERIVERALAQRSG